VTRDWVVNAKGEVEVIDLPDGLQGIPRAEPWYAHPRDPLQPWESQCLFFQSATLEAPDQLAYDERMDLHSKKYLTIIRPSDALWIIDKVKERIAGKVVVEVGAGIGVLATALAGHASHVYAIEADPMWSWVFARYLYQNKPSNLTYILDAAENLVDVIEADVAICVTGSAEVLLRDLCGRFAPEVIMPWQDWNEGRAISKWGRRF
jgi:protein-L-isoaspartate O-methyltransferase